MNIGRPRKINPEHALEAAMTAFREKGYEATSMSDLVAATGLHKGSLYQTFGDKHELFLAVLDKYMQEVFRVFESRIASKPNPVEAIRHALYGMLEIASEGQDSQLGCIAVNSMVEFSSRDHEVNSLIAKMDAKIIVSLTALTNQAVKEQLAQQTLPTDMVMTLIMSCLAGLCVTLKTVVSLEGAKNVLDEQLALLGYRLS
jgi:TetR/AcrR family transcriptional repressor of nem operon